MGNIIYVNMCRYVDLMNRAGFGISTLKSMISNEKVYKGLVILDFYKSIEKNSWMKI